MKREALRVARRFLKGAIISAEAFNGALHAILTLAGRLKSWSPLVESA